MRLSPALVSQRSSAVATGIGFFVTLKGRPERKLNWVWTRTRPAEAPSRSAHSPPTTFSVPACCIMQQAGLEGAGLLDAAGDNPPQTDDPIQA